MYVEPMGRVNKNENGTYIPSVFMFRLIGTLFLLFDWFFYSPFLIGSLVSLFDWFFIIPFWLFLYPPFCWEWSFVYFSSDWFFIPPFWLALYSPFLLRMVFCVLFVWLVLHSPYFWLVLYCPFLLWFLLSFSGPFRGGGGGGRPLSLTLTQTPTLNPST